MTSQFNKEHLNLRSKTYFDLKNTTFKLKLIIFCTLSSSSGNENPKTVQNYTAKKLQSNSLSIVTNKKRQLTLASLRAQTMKDLRVIRIPITTISLYEQSIESLVQI